MPQTPFIHNKLIPELKFVPDHELISDYKLILVIQKFILVNKPLPSLLDKNAI
jgi:hypothetical protein